MNESKIDWDSAPTDACVWIQDDNPDNGCDFSGWYNPLNVGRYTVVDGGDRYLPLTTKWKYSVHHRPVEGKVEWVPNGRCEHLYSVSLNTAEWEKVNIIGIDKLGNYVFQNDKSTCYYSDPASEFRPLKTAEEKEREAFYLAVVDACMGIHKDDFNIDEIAGILFHADFKAPKAEK